MVRTVAGKKTGFFDKFKLLFSSPTDFFERIQGESINNAFLAYSVTLLISRLVGFLQSTLFYDILAGFIGRPSIPPLGYFFGGYFNGFFMIISFFVLSLLFLFGYTGIVHLFAKALKGSGSYGASFKAVAYSLVPFNLISIIPFVGWLSIFYSLVLSVFGIKKLHGLSTGKAATVVLLPIFIIAILFFALIAGIFFLALRSAFRTF